MYRLLNAFALVVFCTLLCALPNRLQAQTLTAAAAVTHNTTDNPIQDTGTFSITWSGVPSGSTVQGHLYMVITYKYALMRNTVETIDVQDTSVFTSSSGSNAPSFDLYPLTIIANNAPFPNYTEADYYYTSSCNCSNGTSSKSVQTQQFSIAFD